MITHVGVRVRNKIALETAGVEQLIDENAGKPKWNNAHCVARAYQGPELFRKPYCLEMHAEEKPGRHIKSLGG
jgi:hypothetical protein